MQWVDPGTDAVVDEAWTNPNLGNLAVAVATIKKLGFDGERLVRTALRRLGRGTGRHMVEEGMLSIEWGPREFAGHLVDMMEQSGVDWNPVIDEGWEGSYLIHISTHPYREQLDWLDAPSTICDVVAEWDRGIAEVLRTPVNIVHTACSLAGDEGCIWLVSKGLAGETIPPKEEKG